MTGFFDVVVIAGPGEEGRVLEGAGKRESDGPGVGAVFDNFGEVGGGLLGSLAAGKKDDAGEIFGDMVFKDLGSLKADFLGSGLDFLLFAG